MMKDDPTLVRINGNQYSIGVQNHSPPCCRGFYGALYVIEFFDGRKVGTINLWDNGTIPEHLRERLPDNARFLTDGGMAEKEAALWQRIVMDPDIEPKNRQEAFDAYQRGEPYPPGDRGLPRVTIMHFGG